MSKCQKFSVGESFTVAIISGIEKFWLRGRKYQDLPSKTFCLTVQRIFVGEPFNVSLISGIEKVWLRGGGGSIKYLRRIFFVSECRKISVRDSFTVAIISGSEKVWIRGGRGEYQDFQSKVFFVSLCRKFSVGNPSVFH